MDEALLLRNIDEAVKRAADVLDGKELPFLDDEEAETAWAEMHHCGTCTVRTVMDVVWPALVEYQNFLREQADGPMCCQCCG